MKTITLSVNDQIANRLAVLNQKEIDTIMHMVQTVLEDGRSLKEIILDAQDQAERKGLTQDKLDQILRELE